MELVLRTEFRDLFPPGMIWLVIANLHRTVVDERTDAELASSIAILITVRGKASTETGSVLAESDKSHLRIVWTVRAVEGELIARRRLRAFEECVALGHSKCLHYLTMDCKSKGGCGRRG